ncbi:hypothetical protein OROGR_004418 [Orobanche gracilis]
MKTKKDVIQKKNPSEISRLTKGRKNEEEREPGSFGTITMNCPQRFGSGLDFFPYREPAISISLYCTITKDQKKQYKKIELVDPVSVYQGKSKAKASGASSSKRKRADKLSNPNDSTQAEDDDIEEFSSTSQDISASDEDWAA